ncbi:hypothetical protein [Enterobacter hormaechei]|nr:hypothetical protein [Enterobacter hormaechei]CZY58974.1 Uncharacterised protein [Enterobacter hormaechei]CZY63242.1 Uncharacterised protein [Enterobacter hormaechei]CZY72877.1 Uncharacterised protein [Enterobacter hormaechei]SAF36595.1 Uncharacterised protein [Enterobacter hormaechei]
MKKFWEMAMLTILFAAFTGMGLTFGVAGAYGWLRFIADLVN